MPSPQDVFARRRSLRQLHASGCFVIPKPWDAGSAKYLEARLQGLRNIATSIERSPEWPAARS